MPTERITSRGSGFIAIKKLAQGAQGGCWLVEHKEDKHLAVMKASFPGTYDPNFSSEVDILRELRKDPLHPNILDMFRYNGDACNVVVHGEVHHLDSLCYYAFYSGGDLVNHVPFAGRPYVEEAFLLHVFKSMASALAYLHLGWDTYEEKRPPKECKPICHRDIKPDNIFLEAPLEGRPYPRVVLGDFGFAQYMSRWTDVYCGTAGFIPPENFGSREGDIYSLGATIHELADATLPYPTDHRYYSIPRSRYSEKLDRLIWDCCRIDRYKRLTAKELFKSFETITKKPGFESLEQLPRNTEVKQVKMTQSQEAALEASQKRKAAHNERVQRRPPQLVKGQKEERIVVGDDGIVGGRNISTSPTRHRDESPRPPKQSKPPSAPKANIWPQNGSLTDSKSSKQLDGLIKQDYLESYGGLKPLPSLTNHSRAKDARGADDFGRKNGKDVFQTAATKRYSPERESKSRETIERGSNFKAKYHDDQSRHNIARGGKQSRSRDDDVSYRDKRGRHAQESKAHQDDYKSSGNSYRSDRETHDELILVEEYDDPQPHRNNRSDSPRLCRNPPTINQDRYNIPDDGRAYGNREKDYYRGSREDERSDNNYQGRDQGYATNCGTHRAKASDQVKTHRDHDPRDNNHTIRDQDHSSRDRGRDQRHRDHESSHREQKERDRTPNIIDRSPVKKDKDYDWRGGSSDAQGHSSRHRYHHSGKRESERYEERSPRRR